MKLKNSILIVCSLMSLVSFAITPKQAGDLILKGNGDVLLSQLMREAKNSETLSIANAPDPEIEADYMVAPSGVDNRWGVGVGYEFEWPGVYGARKKLGGAMRDANDARMEADVFEKRCEILDEIWAWLYAERREEMMRQVKMSVDSVYAVASRSHKGGEISKLDLSKIAIELSRMRSTTSAIELEKIEIEGRLNTLNGGMQCKEVLNAIDKDWNPVQIAPLEIYLEQTKGNPVLADVIAQHNVAEKNISVAKSERLPGFKVGYSHEFEDGMHFNGVNFGVSIPLFSSRNKLKSAEAVKAAAEYEMTVATDKLESRITSLYDEIASLDQAIKIPEDVFTNTDYTNLLLKAYRGGELSITEYLLELSWFYEAHLEYMELQYQRERKAAQLEALEP